MTKTTMKIYSSDGIDTIIHGDGRKETRDTPIRVGGCEHPNVKDTRNIFLADESGKCTICHDTVRRSWLPPNTAKDKWHWGAWH